MNAELRVPDSTQPIRAIRLWRSSPTGLRAVIKSFEWSLGMVNKAECQQMKTSLRLGPHPAAAVHSAPEETCQCGFWAFPDMPSLYKSALHHLTRSRMFVPNPGSAVAIPSYSGTNNHLPHHYRVGIVALWGKVVIGREGYRAEYAQIIEMVGYLGTRGYELAPWTSQDEWNLTPFDSLIEESGI